MAASATFALNAGVWFRRLLMSLLIRRHNRARCQAELRWLRLFGQLFRFDEWSL